MSLNEPQEQELKTGLLVTRILAFALCYASPVLYALVYGIAVLTNRWSLFLQGFGTVPWTNPLVLGLLTVSATTLAGAFLLPDLLLRAQLRMKLPPLPALRTRSLIAFAMLEAVAIYGLVLGFVVGPPVASLTLALLLVPPAACPLLLGSEEQWRERLRDHA